MVHTTGSIDRVEKVGITLPIPILQKNEKMPWKYPEIHIRSKDG